MELTPKALRDVEFREKRHGYHHEDVDQFLEEVASGLEVLEERLRQAVERAQRAEAAAAEAGGSDETLRKTLVLAQRTADLAVQEAREQAARILAGAEQQAQSMLAEAEERSQRALEESATEVRAEIQRLEGQRAQSQQQVDGLSRWIDEHKQHLQASLSEALAAVERAGTLWAPPTTRPIEAPPQRQAPPAAPPRAEQRPQPAPPVEVELEEVEPGPETAVWTPDEVERAEASSPPPPSPRSERLLRDELPPQTDSDDDRAMDDFFDESSLSGEDRRFGGRLRRRR